MDAAAHDKEAISTNAVSDAKQMQRSIIYGSIATPIRKPETDHTHKWSIYVKGAHDEDIGTYVKRVVFRLHESFPNPSRAVECAPFEVSETGWGEFQVQIKIVFQDSNQKPVNLLHNLKLYATVEDAAAMQVKNFKPVISEHYEELIFDPPSDIMQSILEKDGVVYDDIKTSPRFEEYLQMEKEELQRIEAALSQVKEKLAEVENSAGKGLVPSFGGSLESVKDSAGKSFSTEASPSNANSLVTAPSSPKKVRK